MLRKALGVTSLVVLVCIAGCGGGSPPPPGTPSAAEYLVNTQDLRQQPPGSSQEALLRWWRTIQYNDIPGYLSELATPLRHQSESDGLAKRDLPLASGELVRSQPKIVDVQHENKTTTIFTQIETRQPVGATRFTTSSYPQAFTLIREGNQWKIADDSFVETRAEDVRKALNTSK